MPYPLTYILADDDELYREYTLLQLNNIPGLTCIGICENALATRAQLEHFQPDLLILDVEMPGITGIQLAKSIKQLPLTIFITSHPNYAADAFELDAVDYLVKPVSFERFFKAITKLNRLMGREVTVTTTNEAPDLAAFIYLKVDRDMKKVYVNDIEYIESWKDFVKIFLTGGRHLLVKRAISAIENILSDHKFIRVHRSYIVSLSKISGYNALAVHIGQCEIPIGRLYKQSVIERLQSKESA